MHHLKTNVSLSQSCNNRSRFVKRYYVNILKGNTWIFLEVDPIFLDLRLGLGFLEDILARLNIGRDAKANTLRPIVFAVAVPTEDLALSLTEH